MLCIVAGTIANVLLLMHPPSVGHLLFPQSALAPLRRLDAISLFLLPRAQALQRPHPGVLVACCLQRLAGVFVEDCNHAAAHFR